MTATADPFGMVLGAGRGCALTPGFQLSDPERRDDDIVMLTRACRAGDLKLALEAMHRVPGRSLDCYPLLRIPQAVCAALNAAAPARWSQTHRDFADAFGLPDTLEDVNFRAGTLVEGGRLADAFVNAWRDPAPANVGELQDWADRRHATSLSWAYAEWLFPKVGNQPGAHLTDGRYVDIVRAREALEAVMVDAPGPVPDAAERRQRYISTLADELADEPYLRVHADDGRTVLIDAYFRDGEYTQLYSASDAATGKLLSANTLGDLSYRAGNRDSWSQTVIFGRGQDAAAVVSDPAERERMLAFATRRLNIKRRR